MLDLGLVVVALIGGGAILLAQVNGADTDGSSAFCGGLLKGDMPSEWRVVEKVALLRSADLSVEQRCELHRIDGELEVLVSEVLGDPEDLGAATELGVPTYGLYDVERREDLKLDDGRYVSSIEYTATEYSGGVDHAFADKRYSIYDRPVDFSTGANYSFIKVSDSRAPQINYMASTSSTSSISFAYSKPASPEADSEIDALIADLVEAVAVEL